MNHRFVIGIGSQRAGSTLLHSLLSDHSDVFMHPVKELHFFDTLADIRPSSALVDYSIRQLSREIDRLVSSKSFNFFDKKYRCYLRSNKILAFTELSKVNYEDLFRPCIGGRRFIGEVTPEYMLLDGAHLENMRNVVGRDAIIILMARNPVDRIVSAVKLMNVYNNMGMDSVAAEIWLNRMMEDGGKWMEHQDKYNQYEFSADRFKKLFNNVFVLSYNHLLGNPRKVAKCLARETDILLDLEGFSDGIGSIRNDLGKNFIVSDGLRNRLEERYSDSSKFVSELDRCATVVRY